MQLNGFSDISKVLLKFVLRFGDDKHVLCGYIDANMAGDVDTKKSTSGYMMTFAGGAVSWQSKL